MGLAALGSLTDDLVTAVVKFPADQKESTRVLDIRRRAQASLRPSGHSLTDQFVVARQLEGLQEKFQVVNRDELAGALRGRLVELENYRSNWTPEILSLLLQLSDRPAALAKLDNLSKPIQPPAEESLSLSDLKSLGGAFSEEDIWEQVDFTADSSDDELASISSEESRPRAPPRTPSLSEQDYVIPDEVFVSGEDRELIASIEKVQFWKPENYHQVTRQDENPSRVITELQLARETIFMLQGLPTSIFWRLDDDIEVDRSYNLAHSSSKALASLLHSFTEIGAKIDAVRRFTHIPQTIPYMQTFSRGLEERLLEFDTLLSQTQCEYLKPGSTISLLQLLDDVRLRSHHLRVLADLISRLKQFHTQPMRCLDLLYDSLWMETGHVDPMDTAFFVRVNRENGDLRTLWHDWHMLDEGVNQQNIPQFLEPAVNRVFTTGKSMVFLRHLNALPEPPEFSESAETIFDHAISSEPSFISLPFAALVDLTFDKLVDANHSVSAGILRIELDEQCGLWSSLDALEHVYLGKDLSILGTIDTKVFELMDRGRAWDDKFLLTEVTRSAFSVMPEIDLSRLVVRSEGSSHHQNRSVHILESVSIDYVLPWPIANIITQDAIQSYQRIARFLMQVRRAKYALVRQRVRDARVPTAGDTAQTLVHGLHHHLLWFLDVLYSHLTYFVISTANQSFRSTLSHTEDVDSMIAAHQIYMSSLENECLVSENLSPIHEVIINILDMCIHFADLQAVHAYEAAASEDGMSDSRFIPSKPRRSTGIENCFDSDSDEDEDDGLDHEQTMTISFRDSPYDLQMQNLKLQFDHLIGFVTDGLKGIARADGLPSWNILAERLEWRKRLA
ncbi:hypothetical protein N7451_007905 [Penicillium sp. IBT 35674x]|nr:hypothetical protein N7451_007905 [Penicillium sp. IBT 35674x]